MNTPFEVGKTYKTRGGWDATVVSHKSGVDGYPMIALHHGQVDITQTHMMNGTYSCGTDKNDLIAPEKPKKRVPLTAADVPPGSVMRGKGQPGFFYPTVEDTGITFASTVPSKPEITFATWLECMNNAEIKRPRRGMDAVF